MSDQARPSEPTVQATRAQMELARLLGVPFCADHDSQQRAATDPNGSLVPGLPDDPPGIVSLYLRLPIETVQALVDVLREQTPLLRRD